MTRVNVGRWSLVLCGLLVAACVGVGVIIGIVITPMAASAQAVKTFEAPAGMILNYVESERTASFDRETFFAISSIERSSKCRNTKASACHAEMATKRSPSASSHQCKFR